MPFNRPLYVKEFSHILAQNNVMLFIMGARQVGKTTLSQLIAKEYKQHLYLNWDIDEHKELILSGQKFIEKIYPLESIAAKPLIVFDELHKFKHWKNYLKGFYDLYKEAYKVIVTGSAHLNIFQKGGDSLMGRYLPFTLHPISIGELNPFSLGDNGLRQPHQIAKDDYEALYQFGGFPVPFLQRNSESYNQWRRTRRSQLFREDIRDLTHIHEVSQLELLAQLISHQSSHLLNRANYAKKLQVSIQTIGRWIDTLKQFYYAFTLAPWSTNIPHSLIKEPKIFLHDWSLVNEEGARFETFVAAHLRKSVDFWSEKGKGDFALYFLRDKKQREVDFLITKDSYPWILVEAKTSQQPLSQALRYYQDCTGAPFAFQVTKDMDYVDYDCFTQQGAYLVPAKTFLSQLI